MTKITLLAIGMSFALSASAAWSAEPTPGQQGGKPGSRKTKIETPSTANIDKCLQAGQKAAGQPDSNGNYTPAQEAAFNKAYDGCMKN